MKGLILPLLLLLTVLVAACGGGPDTTAPPEILYGQDVCDRCNMIISEERFAAAYWTTGGVARRFDDVGGMLAYYYEESEEVASFWVHDYAGGRWLPAEEATYAFAPDLITPMGFGVVALATAAEAEALAAGHEGAHVLTFDQLLAEAEAGNVDFYAHPPHGEDDAAHQ
jgi:nitrous oxide reductase accessory protein NosL